MKYFIKPEKPMFITKLIKKYNAMVEKQAFALHYNERNNPTSVEPFLAGMQCTYVMVGQLIFVKDSTVNVQVLIDAGFTEFPSVSTFQDVAYYHVKFNIELRIMPSAYWASVMLANKVIVDMSSRMRIPRLNTSDNLVALTKLLHEWM